MSDGDVIGDITGQLVIRLNGRTGVGRAASVPPDQIGKEEPAVTIWLYQILPDAARRNMDTPWKTHLGEVAAPPLALSLRYLLTAPVAPEIEAQKILGHAMQILHEEPIVLPMGGAAPYENARITMRPLSIEELERIWMGAQMPRRLSVGYDVDVVLIESSKPVRTPLPVLIRAPFDEFGKWTVDVMGSPPSLDRLDIGDAPVDVLLRQRGQPGRPSIEIGFTLGFHGTGLETATEAVLTSLRYPQIVARFPVERDEDRLIVRLTPAAPVSLVDKTTKNVVQGTVGANFPAGPCSIELELPSRVGSVRSNAMPVMLGCGFAPPVANNGSIVLSGLNPPIQPDQTVALLVGSASVSLQRATSGPGAKKPAPKAGKPAVAPAAASGAVATFDLSGTALPTGMYPVRLRVDGADSNIISLEIRPVAGQPAGAPQLGFDTTRMVTWP